jgi:hypothetical protein
VLCRLRPALGAALMALKALGHITDYAQARALLAVERVQQPDMARHDLCMCLYAVCKQVCRDALRHWDELERLSKP